MVTIQGHELRIIFTNEMGFVRDGNTGIVRRVRCAADFDAGTLTIYGRTEAERVRNAFFAGRDLAEDAARQGFRI